MARYSHTTSIRTAGVVGVILVALLAVVAGVLVFWAVTDSRAPEEQPAPYIPGPISQGAAIPTEPLVPSQRLVLPVDDVSAWRFTTGACGAVDPTAEATTDGGGTWARVDLAGPVDVAAVQSGEISGTVPRLTVAARADCSGSVIERSGDAWIAATSGVTQWSVYADGGTRVVTGHGLVEAPCTVVDAAARDDRDGIVLCADQTLVRTSDGGSSWGPSVTLPGAAAVAVVGERFLVAAGRQEGCSGTAIVSMPTAPADTTGEVAGCADVPYDPTATDLAARGAAVWIWAGGAVAVSQDGGATWP